MSRELFKPRWVQLFCLELTEYTELPWKIYPQIAAVCAPTGPGCWQHVIFSHLRADQQGFHFAHTRSYEDCLLTFRSARS